MNDAELHHPSATAVAAVPRRPRLTGALMLLAGAALGAGGGWLVALGGSWFYLLAGLALGLSGLLVFAGSALALTVYALLVLGTALWSLWEVGLDWWPLAARGDLVFVLGCWLLLPHIARGLGLVHDGAGRWPAPRALLALLLAGFAAVALASGFVDHHRIDGQAPPPRTGGVPSVAPSPPVPDGAWHAYGRTGQGQRWSPLAQITAANVGQLAVAWHVHTGDRRGRPGDPVETTFEATPLKVGERLFLCTPHQDVIALDATSGAELWRFSPAMPAAGSLALQHLTCRGLSYHVHASAPAATPAGTPAAKPAAKPAASAAAPPTPTACRDKLFMPTADARLVALDPATGRRCPGFGRDGEVDLWQQMPNVKPGSYYSTSPVAVSERLLIVAGTVLDNFSMRETSGVVRAYDVDTGALVWAWDSGRPDDARPLPAGQTYTPNSPNSWSVASVDEALGLVYLPMGNEPPDQWGGRRSAATERFSSSVVALELATGRVRWVFQTVHHDLWDYDVPAQPVLVDLTLGGQAVPALVQPTKQGELFVLDRRDGRPLLPVTERPAPQGAAQGDRTAPTQPASALSFEPPPLRERDMWGATPFDQLACRIAFRRLRYEGRFTPPSTQGTLVHPGNFGVFNWGSVAVDPQRQIVFATPASLAFVSRLVPRPDDRALLVQHGEPPKGALPPLNENFGAPYAVQLSPFTSALGLPCQAPPWGMVAAADLATGRVLWRHVNGTVRDSSPLPLPLRMGVPSLGGPIVTAGGVAFLSGTLDRYVRGYDVANGRELWRARLPAGGQATPMTYEGADGRQYLVVVAGGHGSLGTKAGDDVIAYALPAR